MAEPTDFRNEAGNHGSRLSMSFSRYKGQDDVATVSLYVITYTNNIPLDIHVPIKEVWVSNQNNFMTKLWSRIVG